MSFSALHSVKFLQSSPLTMWIDNHAVSAQDGATFAAINPADGTTLARVPDASSADVDAAVRAARQAFDHGPWPRWHGRERAAYLMRIAAGIRQHAAELVELDVRNMGKPIAEAQADAADAAHCFEYYAGLARCIQGETLSVPDNALSMVLREPVGVVGQIIPWNYPLLMAAWKIAPALAAGCAVVLKPAEQSPLSALRFAQILAALELPSGVVNIITGGPSAGEALVRHPGVDKVAFTGGVDTGRLVMRNASETLKRLTIELGGKSPNIIFADANFDAAVEGALSAAFANQGEVCSAGSRLLVQDTIYERVLAAVQSRAQRIRLGNPLDPSTQMGPLVSDAQRQRVLDYIELGKQSGLRLLCGGGPPRDATLKDGFYVLPTLFADVDNGHRLAQEEIFGPVLVAMPFRDEAEAVRLANDSLYGLAGAVWTRDVFRGIRVLKQLRAGILWLNTYHPTYNEAPWGGYKQSGFGRELGTYGLEPYLEVKQLNIHLDDAPANNYR